MALIPCYECDKEINHRAPACPHCGATTEYVDQETSDDSRVIYYPDGKLKEKATFKDGKRSGPFELYHENGQLEEKGYYSNGKPVGPFKRYYENGQLKAKEGFYLGERKIACEFYYPDGTLGTMVDEKGTYNHYYENGQLKDKGTYMYGEKNGLFKFYYSDGQLVFKGSYSGGKECGPWLRFGLEVIYADCSR